MRAIREPAPIEDASDERIAAYTHLTDSALRRSREADEGIFIAEGGLVIEQLLRSPYPIESFLVTPAKLPLLERLIDGADTDVDLDVPIYVAEPRLMETITGFAIHRGLVAAGRRIAPAGLDESVRSASVIAVLEGINDHENMGALFRNAAAFGVGAVVLNPRCCDPLYRRSVRVSMGHVLRVPFLVLDDWPGGLSRLRERGFRTIALTPAAQAVDLTDVARGGRVAVLLGAEGEGLSAAALAAADVCVRIPMAPGVDSLNVATAAAIAFHHFHA